MNELNHHIWRPTLAQFDRYLNREREMALANALTGRGTHLHSNETLERAGLPRRGVKR